MSSRPRAVVLALCALWSARAHADEGPAPYWVDFEAGHVVLDPELARLELSRGVRIRVDRYRLTSDRLTLRRTGRGVEIDGEGRVSFCPCENAPVTFGFRQAIVAPPTDLFVKNATVRVGDVPVLWTPVLWLRSADRVGLLPPRLAYRGEDGFFGGAGVHLPLGGRRGPTLSALDLAVGGYLRAGVEVDARLTTPTSSARVRWDHVERSLLAIDAHGAFASRDEAVGAYRVDALRGARALSGTQDLEPVARRFDHARAGVGAAGRGAVGALGAVLVAERGTALDARAAAGPVAFLGAGGPLGPSIDADAFVEASTLGERGQPTRSALLHRAELFGSTHAGPVRFDGRLHEEAALATRESDDDGSLLAAARASLSLPLVRAFGDGPDPLVHRVEPLLDLGARAAERRGDGVAVAAPARLALGAVGLDTALGRYGAREAMELSARAGAAGDPERELRPQLAARLGIDAEWVGARGEGAARADTTRALHSGGHLRVGRSDGLHLESHAIGSLDEEPRVARALLGERFEGALDPYLDAPGWSAGSRLGIPWTRQLASHLATEADVSRARWLAWRAALAYRHPCGCFAVLGRTGQRVGRKGIDAEVTLDLMP